MGAAGAMVIGGLIQGGLSAYGASQQAGAADRATEAQTLAQMASIASQLGMYVQNREDTAPWRTTGAGALNKLSYLMGVTPDTSQNSFDLSGAINQFGGYGLNSGGSWVATSHNPDGTYNYQYYAPVQDNANEGKTGTPDFSKTGEQISDSWNSVKNGFEKGDGWNKLGKSVGLDKVIPGLIPGGSATGPSPETKAWFDSLPAEEQEYYRKLYPDKGDYPITKEQYDASRQQTVTPGQGWDEFGFGGASPSPVPVAASGIVPSKLSSGTHFKTNVSQQPTATDVTAGTVGYGSAPASSLVPTSSIVTGAAPSTSLATTSSASPSAPSDFGMLTQKFQFDPNTDPSYQWRYQQGLEALEKSAAAKGGYFSGQTGKDLQTYGQGMASQEYANAFNRNQIETSDIYNRLAALAGTGQTATTQLGYMGQNTASGIGGAYGNIGQAQAGGYMNAANAWSGAYQNIGNQLASGIGQYAQYKMMEDSNKYGNAVLV